MIRKYDIVYFMASVDKPEDNKKFSDQLDLDYPILSDPDKKIAEAYGVLSPINPDRPTQERVARRWTFYIGPDGKILAIDKTPGTQNAGETLVAKLKELGVKEK